MDTLAQIEATHEAAIQVTRCIQDILASEHGFLIHKHVESANPTATWVSDKLERLEGLLRSEFGEIDTKSGEFEPSRQHFADACQPVNLSGTDGSCMHDAVVKHASRLIRTIDDALFSRLPQPGERLFDMRFNRGFNKSLDVDCGEPIIVDGGESVVVEHWDVVSAALRGFPKLDFNYVSSILKAELKKARRAFGMVDKSSKKTERLPQDDPEKECAHAPDFRSVYWFGDTHVFTATQAACIKVLWENWQQGTPAVGEQTILETVESSSRRLRDVFDKGRHPAWGRMIQPAGKGAFQLVEHKKS